ncbi:hypothetical protein [Luteolibacter luteus]|uniref:DUF4424 domain-containing protein n=1 Tax=Luteolibacter luteus TaxID=2728835 RepID=A0A858RGH8_9BACT|nr:hypothetical protein [Luteolibacter luteus]QJE95947.1 hypothetical protein HHL09_09185 [Luteolibacter luteus]
MKPFNPLLSLVSAAALLLGASAKAEDSMRLVAIKAAPKEAAELRKALADPLHSTKSMTIDTLAKRGMTVLGDFTETNPWRMESVKMTKITGSLKAGGQIMKELGVVAAVEGGKFGTLTADSLEAEIALSGKGQTYLSWGVMGNMAVIKSGVWRERAWWNDGKDTFMLWQFPEVTAPGDPKRQGGGGNWDCVKVEMRWFQANDADIEKINQAAPENRDKALEWLVGKAKLWKDCGFRARTGERSMWHSLEVEMAMVDGDAAEIHEGLSLDGYFAGQEDNLRIEWDVEAPSKKKPTARFQLAAPVKPGVWTFLPVKDVPFANVVACRLTRE